MDISVLEDLGLSASEIKVYTALMSLGLSKAGPIVRSTKLQNSVVHLALGRLVDNGLVSFVRRGLVKFYQPCDPHSILRLIDEKHRRAQILISELLEKQSHAERNEAAVYVGFSGFKAMCYEFIEGANPGDEYLFFAFSTKSKTYDAEVNSFYSNFTVERLNRGLILRGIAHIDTKPYFVQNQRDLSGIIFVNFPVIMNTSICRNRVIFTPWEDAQISFMITSRHLAENLREYFYSIWKVRE